MKIDSIYLTIPLEELNDLPLYTRSFILLPLPVFIGNTQYQLWGDGDVYLRACARYTEGGRGKYRGRSFVQKGFTPWELTGITFDTEPASLRGVSKMCQKVKLTSCFIPAVLHGNFGKITVIVPLEQLHDLHSKVAKAQTVGDKKTATLKKHDKI